MGLREQINQKPQIVGGAVVVFVVVAAVVTYLSTRNTAASVVARMYYSDDDGKTYFADATSRVFPFDHNSRPAYRAYVFQGSGQPYVAYLSAFPPAAKAELDQLKGKEGDPAAAATIAALRSGTVLVKRPGEANWVGQSSAEGMKIQAVLPADGSMVHQLTP